MNMAAHFFREQTMFKTISTLGLAAAIASSAMAAEQWQTSWYAAPQPGWDAGFALPTNMPPALHDQTVRESLRLSAGGRRVRVVLSNRYGTEPLVIGEARLARTVAGAADSAPLSFGGTRSVTVAPGRQAVSDALDFSRWSGSVFRPISRSGPCLPRSTGVRSKRRISPRATRRPRASSPALKRCMGGCS
jgi:hypothetical protein